VPALLPTARPRRTAALLAAAVVLGLVTGFGMRAGLPLALFDAAALRLRGLPEFLAPDARPGLWAVVGLVHTALLAYAWGLAAAALARSVRGWLALAALVALAVVIAWLDARLPVPLRLVAGALAPMQRLVAVAALVTAAAAGIRLASYHVRAPVTPP
jgi:hypothetical protein